MLVAIRHARMENKPAKAAIRIGSNQKSWVALVDCSQAGFDAAVATTAAIKIVVATTMQPILTDNLGDRM